MSKMYPANASPAIPMTLVAARNVLFQVIFESSYLDIGCLFQRQFAQVISPFPIVFLLVLA
jgi:hypothetical protein